MGEGLLDGRRTSFEWRDAAPDICVFPVGAFEQHSTHLPLAADNIEADYFGRFVAEQLGAALLPTQAIATSLEHTGFMGTVTLRPETLMQIVRDVADDVEMMGFKTMILLNCHGGNFALTPVVRDINRRDRALKILKVDFYAFFDRETLEGGRQGKWDIHSGEFETSLMLALAPELVKDKRSDLEPNVQGFVQSDLTTFGVGTLSDSGSCGPASLGSKEKGEAIVASIKTNMMAHIRERLEWLDQNRTYSGKGLKDR